MEIVNFEESHLKKILDPFILDLEGNIDELASCFEDTLRLLETIEANQLPYSYAPGKWTLQALLMHMVDSTQILSIRLLSIVRGDHVVFPVSNEDVWAQHIDYTNIDLAYIKEGYSLQTDTILWYLKSAKQPINEFITCNQTKINYQEMLRYIIGHERLHKKTIREKYLIQTIN